MAKKPNARKKGVRTAMSADPEEKNAANGELREGANVDKIRDILFGSNMREYEKRFARLEERLTKSSDALREDLKKRFDSLRSASRFCRPPAAPPSNTRCFFAKFRKRRSFSIASFMIFLNLSA